MTREEDQGIVRGHHTGPSDELGIEGAAAVTEDGLVRVGAWNRSTLVTTPGVLSGGLTVWHVRKFVAALGRAGISDSVAVSCRHANDTRHLMGLSVEWTERRDGEREP